MTEAYAKGDWLVHPTYGIGQVKKLEKKHVDGRKSQYYRVEGDNTTFWLPVQEAEGSRVRKLASRQQFRRAIRLLKKTPREMDPNHNKRKTRIRDVMSTGSLRAVVRVVRDLSASDSQKRLSDTERRALEQFIDSLVEEWSIAMETDPEEARAELHRMINENEAAPA